MNQPPNSPPGGNGWGAPPGAPPPGGYGPPPGGAYGQPGAPQGGFGGAPQGGFGGAPQGGFGGAPQGGFGGAPQGGFGGAPQGGFGGAPQGGFGQQPAWGPPMGGAPGAMVSGNAPYGIDPVSGMPFSDKTKMTAGLLQIFLGGFGVGRFYTGHTGMAIAQIAVTWLTCGAGALWPLIDGIMMLTGKVTDAQGRPLRDG